MKNNHLPPPPNFVLRLNCLAVWLEKPDTVAFFAFIDMKKYIVERLVEGEYLRLVWEGKKLKLRINSTLPFLYNLFYSQRTIEEQKAEPGHTFSFFLIFFFLSLI